MNWFGIPWWAWVFVIPELAAGVIAAVSSIAYAIYELIDARVLTPRRAARWAREHPGEGYARRNR